MISLRSILSFPLLARELTERAARRRTYAARVVYGLALYAIFVFGLRRMIGNASDETGFGVLGLGRQIFQGLVELQCWGVLIFQPALMAGVLTYEKERDTFPLLLLTHMSPLKMLLEKYLAGLLPMMTLLLLALPVGAITMGYGGVSPQLLASGAIVVLATWLQVGALALLCSAWCRTTTGAMLAAYAGTALIHLLPALCYSFGVRYVMWGADVRGLEVPRWIWSLWPPEAFSRVLAFQETIAASGTTDAAALWMRLLAEAARRCTPLLVTAGVCLLLARAVMLRRAFRVSGAGKTPRLFGIVRVVPAAFRKWLHSLWPKHTDLPGDDPIAWREGMRSVLGSGRRFAAVTAVAAALTFALGLFLLGLYPRTAGPERLQHIAMILGTSAVVIFAVQGTRTILDEHSNQTLEILLTTPLGAAEILRQKARALRRFWVVLGVMLAVIFALKGWAENEYLPSDVKWRIVAQYWICNVLALLVYPPLIVWTSLLIALWLRAKVRAMAATLLLVLLWFAVPEFILSTLSPYARHDSVNLWLSLLSPLGIVVANESNQLGDFSNPFTAIARWLTESNRLWLIMAFNFLTYALVLALVRHVCLRLAETRMCRGGG